MRKLRYMSFAGGLSVVLLASCGSGSSVEPAAPGASPAAVVNAPAPAPAPVATVSGTVATGAPLVNAEIMIRCQSGDPVRASTDVNGRFTAELRASSRPCVARATRRADRAADNPVFPDELVSIVLDSASNDALANITPLTHMVVARVFARDPAAVFETPTELVAQSIGAQDVQLAQAQIEEDLRIRIGVQLPGACRDWLSSAFVAERGDEIDDSLELLAERLQQAAKSFAQLLAETSAGQPASARADSTRFACPR